MRELEGEPTAIARSALPFAQSRRRHPGSMHWLGSRALDPAVQARGRRRRAR
jgi:hypothetical protein